MSQMRIQHHWLSLLFFLAENHATPTEHWSKPPGIHKNYTFRYPTFGGGPYRPIGTLRKQSKQLHFTQLANSLDGHLRDRNTRCLWPHSSRLTVTCIEPFEPLEDTVTREFPICDLPAYHLPNSGWSDSQKKMVWKWGLPHMFRGIVLIMATLFLDKNPNG